MFMALDWVYPHEWDNYIQLLVGGFNLPLWKIWKSVGIVIPNIWTNKKWSKPPTRCFLFTIFRQPATNLRPGRISSCSWQGIRRSQLAPLLRSQHGTTVKTKFREWIVFSNLHRKPWFPEVTPKAVGFPGFNVPNLRFTSPFEAARHYGIHGWEWWGHTLQ